jgi:hypothetical protein
MPIRSTIGVDEDFAAVTRRHFSPLAAFAAFFFVTQIACVVVALLTLRGHDPEIAGGYGVDEAQTSSTAGSDSARGPHIDRVQDEKLERQCDPV